MSAALTRPRGLLFDYGGTLVEEVGVNVRAGIDVLLANVVAMPPHVSVDDILARAALVTRDVADRRDAIHIETPWPALTRLIYDYFGIRFTRSLEELELAFWDASVKTRPMPGVRAALDAFRRHELTLGVVSNSSFGANVIRHELAKHGLADQISELVASAEYAVRKPNPFLFEVAAARLGVRASDIWFVGDRGDTDVAGARAAGMTSVWYGPPNATRPINADLAVSAWDELVARVEGAMMNSRGP